MKINETVLIKNRLAKTKLPPHFKGRQFDIRRDGPDYYRDDLLVTNQNP